MAQKQNRISLDRTKLLGFRLDVAATAGDAAAPSKRGAKFGSKLGGKSGSKTLAALGAKFGAKPGFKLAARR